MSEKLHKLRDAIDQIDAEILLLIARRMTLSDEVIAAKNGEAAFRPGREAALVRRLAAMESDMAPAVLLGIWRQIMAASLTRQNKYLTFAVHQAALPAAL
jgi:chorismate mutase